MHLLNPEKMRMMPLCTLRVRGDYRSSIRTTIAEWYIYRIDTMNSRNNTVGTSSIVVVLGYLTVFINI